VAITVKNAFENEAVEKKAIKWSVGFFGQLV
jgi:hypothetical protein